MKTNILIFQKVSQITKQKFGKFKNINGFVRK